MSKKEKAKTIKPLTPQNILLRSKIHLIRGQRVMLDSDLAELYGIPTKSLLRSVKRHPKRFPKGFMFPLAPQEVMDLRCQIGTSSWGGRRYSIRAFNEHGVAMLSSVLNSERAIQVNIAIICEFIALRKAIKQKAEDLKKLSRKVIEIERRQGLLDEDVQDIFLSFDELSARVDRIEKQRNEPTESR